MDTVRDLLEDGYVVVSGRGHGGAVADRLRNEGYAVAEVDLSLLN